jgi:type 1 glutamine amidotransferase
VVELFRGPLEQAGWACTVATDLKVLEDAAATAAHDLIFPCWTMASLTEPQLKSLTSAVAAGTGLAGVHGGMGDAFRGALAYEWMTGGIFVGHPHVGPYSVRVTRPDHETMAGVPAEFPYNSEQYYMLVDPGVEVLADTAYLHEGRMCRMPVVWTKTWGAGRVFYCSLGHDPEEFVRHPHVHALVVRGMLWAAS